MKPTLLHATVLALAAAAPAQAVEVRIEIDRSQLLADAAAGKATAESWRQWGDDLRASLGTLFGESFAATKPVKGAPYSAEVTTELNQTLADGNVISKKTTGRIYRDGEGRSRQETVVGGKTTSIQLRDPVAKSAVMLLPGTKTAVRMPSIAVHKGTKEINVLRLDGKEIRIEDGQVSVDGKAVSGRIELNAGGKSVVIDKDRVVIDGQEVRRGQGSRRVIVKDREEGTGGDGTAREEVRIQVLRSGGGKEVQIEMPSMPHLPPLLGHSGGHLDGALLRSKATTTALGQKEFDGVRAEGKSSVRTIPAGEIGNRSPIQVTSESWYSPDLQVTVYSRQIDPRYGETIYRLSNIRREEPAAELFRVPEDYKVRGSKDKD